MNEKQGIFKAAAVIFIILFVLTGIYLAHAILIPVALAFLFAILLRPVVAWLTNKLKFPHVVAAATTVLVTLCLVMGVITFISKEITSFYDDLPVIKQNLMHHYHNIQGWVYHKFNINYHKQNDYIQQATNKPMGNYLDTFSYILLVTILVPIYTFLMLLYRTLFIKFLTKLIPKKGHNTLREIINEIKTVVRSYITGLMIEMVIIAVVISSGLMLAGVDYAIFLGVLTAILNLIPYIGIAISGVLSLLVCLGHPASESAPLIVIALYCITHVIDANLLIPRIVSSKVSVNALIAMIGIISGELLIGIPGMFLALPTIAILKVIFDRVEGLKPWGYLLGDHIPKTVSWGKIKLPDLNMGREHYEAGEGIETDHASKEEKDAEQLHQEEGGKNPL